MEESWDQIGARLRAAREKKEMSVDDVVFRARIPRTVVEALEAEDFSVFTSPTYAKSFLRQYSEFLDVDAEPWLDALEPAAYVSGDALQPMFAGAETPTLAKRAPRETRRQEAEGAAGPPGTKWSAVWVMFLTAVLVLSVVKGYQIFDERFGKETPAKDGARSSSASASSAPAPGSQPTQAKGSPTTEETEKDPSTASAATPSENKEHPPAVPPPRAIIVRD